MSSDDPQPQPRSLLNRFLLLHGTSGKYLVALIFIGLAVRIVPGLLIYGTDDVGAWRLVIRTFGQHQNPYTTGKLNWPPLWPTLLLYAGRLQEVYGFPDYFAVKVVPILCDTAIAIALYVWFLAETRSPLQAWRLGLCYALNPVAVFTCAVHGQFDALPALFTLLAVMAGMWANKGEFPLQAAVWLALGILTKLWPVALLPLFLRPLPGMGRRILFALIALLPSVISMAILYHLAPDVIVKNVFQYRSAIGWWGWTLPVSLFSVPTQQTIARIGQWLLYGVWLALYAYLWKRGTLAQGACLILLTFYVFTPGFGPQYLVWIVGVAMLGDRSRLRAYTALAAVSLLTLYTFKPFNGTYFGFLRRIRSDAFWKGYAAPHDIFGSALCMFPLWLLCCWWLAGLLRDVQNEPNRHKPDENQV